MPCVRLLHAPNAAFIASAEAPILSFLAPSIFAASSRGKKRGSRHGKSNAVQKEAGEADGTKYTLERKAFATRASCSHRNRSSDPCLHQALATRPRAPYDSASVCHLYADIFSIARRQARSYATARESVPELRPSQPASMPPVEAPNEELMSIQRSKALIVETRRLKSYLEHNSLLQGQQLANCGRYRSLRRRIANIQQWDMREIDLGQENKRGNPDWLIQAFAALDRSVFPRVAQYTREICIIHRAQCVQLASMLLEGVELQDPLRMSKNWFHIEHGLRSSLWKELLIYLLDRKPSRALAFMLILVNDPLLKKLLDPCVLADALGHLSSLHLNEQYAGDPDWSTDPVANQVEFGPGFFHIYKCMLAPHPGVCSQDLLYNIAQTAETKDLKKIFDFLVEMQTRFGFDTLLHYANIFAEAGEVDYALRCLDVLKSGWSGKGDCMLKANHNLEETRTVVVNRQRFRWTCALILRKSVSMDTGYRTTLRLVEKFISMGIKMDIGLYNVVMHNAMDAGDYATAFKLYNSLEEHGLEPDVYSHGILLVGCISQDHPARFHDFAKHCKSIAIDRQDVWLAAEYLHYVYVCLQEEADAEVFSTEIWFAYLSIFDASALKPFVGFQRRLVRDRIESQVEAGGRLMEPNPMALYLMLQVEIKYAMSMGGYQQVLNLYHEFQVFAFQRRHATLTQLAAQPIIWNAFLLAFCKLEQYAAASHVIRMMMDHSPQPNVYSWNIFMQSFFKAGQLHAGERAYEIMRSRNVEPDQFSYSVLLRGYARAQLIDRIGETMQYLDAEHELDPQLLALLSRVLDRDRMISTLEQSRLAKEAARQEAVAREAEERAKRWSVPEFYDFDDEAVMDRDEVLWEVEEQVREVGQQFILPQGEAVMG